MKNIKELTGVPISPSRMGLSLLAGNVLANQIASGRKVIIFDKDSSCEKALAAIQHEEKTT